MPRRLALFACCLAQPAAAQIFTFADHTTAYVIEAGALRSFQQDLQGYRQSNATDGWNATGFTARAEAWLQKPDSWNYGLVLQPLQLRYSGIIQSQLNARGASFSPGTAATLDYEFPSLRATINYDLWPGEATEARIGASLVARYASVRLTAPGSRLTETDVVAFPLLNLGFATPIAGGWSAVATADLFPASRGQGFYDVFAGLRYKTEGRRAFEFGGRGIWGGYLPDTPNELGNRIVFGGLVARFIF